MKINKYLLSTFIIVIIVFVSYFLIPIQSIYDELVLAQNLPKLRCQIQGGWWREERGMKGVYSCFLPTRDAGKECSSSSECSGGLCLADPTKTTKENAVDGWVYGKGKCIEWQTPLGCLETVESGRTPFKTGISATMCYD